MIPVEEGLHTEASTCKRQDGGHRQWGWRGRWGEDGPAEGSEAALMEPTCPHLTKSCKRGQKRQRADRGTYLNWTSSYKGGRHSVSQPPGLVQPRTLTQTLSHKTPRPPRLPLYSALTRGAPRGPAGEEHPTHLNFDLEIRWLKGKEETLADDIQLPRFSDAPG